MTGDELSEKYFGCFQQLSIGKIRIVCLGLLDYEDYSVDLLEAMTKELNKEECAALFRMKTTDILTTEDIIQHRRGWLVSADIIKSITRVQDQFSDAFWYERIHGQTLAYADRLEDALDQIVSEAEKAFHNKEYAR